MAHVRRVAIAVTMALAMVIMVSSAASALGIYPFVIDAEAEPGETARFELSVSSDDEADRIGFQLYGIEQRRDGNLDYVSADTAPWSSWVRLPGFVDIPANSQRKIEGEIRVPANAGGSYHLAIMVESQTRESEFAVAVRVRYAVRLNIRVNRAGLRPDAELQMLGLVRADSGEPVVESVIRNTSPMDYLASAEVTIRDSSMRLLDRVELRPPAGWSNGWTQSRLYPNSEVVFQGFPKAVLVPGQYDIRLFLRYASGRQLIRATTIKVEAGEFTYPEQALAGVDISPEWLDFTLAPGGAASKGIRIENTGSSPIRVLLQPQSPEPGYARAIGAQGELELRGGADFVLQPGRSTTRVVGLRFPKDASPGGYYGAIEVGVFSLEGDLLHIATIQADAQVGQGWKRTAEISGVTAQEDQDGHLISVVVLNTGDVALSPHGQAVIRAADGTVAGSAKLEVEGDTSARVLPGRDITITGLARRLTPGTYSIEVVVGDGPTSLGKADYQVLISRR